MKVEAASFDSSLLQATLHQPRISVLVHLQLYKNSKSLLYVPKFSIAHSPLFTLPTLCYSQLSSVCVSQSLIIVSICVVPIHNISYLLEVLLLDQFKKELIHSFLFFASFTAEYSFTQIYLLLLFSLFSLYFTICLCLSYCPCDI